MRLLHQINGMIMIAILGLFSGCATSTRHLPPVRDFDADRYLGTWYEIARYSHRFERGMEAVSATYTQRADGSIDVLNRGFLTAEGEWRSASATARFAGEADVGELRVTFFWPFSGAYKIIALDDEGYRWAVVTSGTMNYLWFLAREPSVSPAVAEQLKTLASDAGFDLGRLEWVDQSRNQ